MVLERFAAATLAAAVFCGPLLLGATAPWPRFALDVAMGAAAIAWVLARRRSLAASSLPLAVAGLAALQAARLPDSLLALIAPASADAWTMARAAGPAAWGSISVDPGTSLRGARQIFLAIATIVVVADVVRDPVNRRVMNATLAAVGLTIALLAAVFPPTTDNRIALGCIDLSGPIWFWKTPVDAPVQTAGFSESDVVTAAGRRYVSDSWIVGDRVGSYVVSNHYAGGVCLTLPFVLGGWLAFARPRMPRPAVWIALLAVAMFAVWTVAGVARSRAGTASVVLALLVFGWLVAEGRVARLVFATLAGLAAAMIVCGVFALHGPVGHLVWLVPEPLRPGVEPLLHDARALASRLAGAMWTASPLLGVGLGCYYEFAASVLPRAPWAFAHNDYAQLLAETGLVGGIVAVAGIRRLGSTWLRWTRLPPTARRPQDAAPWAALAGIAAHSFFDWNLHVPANALLATVAAGLALASAPPHARRHAPAAWRGGLTRAVTCGFVITTLAVVALLGRDAGSDAVERTMRAAEADARLYATDRARPSPQPVVEAAILAGQRTVARDPANAHLWLMLGRLALHAADLSPEIGHVRAVQAAVFFTRARRACAVVRGLPVPEETAAPQPPVVDGPQERSRSRVQRGVPEEP